MEGFMLVKAIQTTKRLKVINLIIGLIELDLIELGYHLKNTL